MSRPRKKPPDDPFVLTPTETCVAQAVEQAVQQLRIDGGATRARRARNESMATLIYNAVHAADHFHDYVEMGVQCSLLALGRSVAFHQVICAAVVMGVHLGVEVASLVSPELEQVGLDEFGRKERVQ